MASMGRLNASSPLATLRAAPGWARIEIRPALTSRLMGYQAHTFQADTATTAFPVGGRLRTTGIGHQSTNEPPSYFWCSGREEILTALGGCGFRVDWQEADTKLR